MDITKRNFRGLSGTGLKLIALILMTLDHIHYFFGFTGMIPEWFSMLGRLAAPLFLFCLAEGFAHTHNRRHYFLKVYIISFFMNGLLFLMQYVRILVRPDGFFPLNGMMSAFVILMPIWQGMDWLRQKRWLRGTLFIVLPLAWPLIASTLASIFPQILNPLAFTAYAVFPMWNSNPDASLMTLLTGILLYAFRNRRKLQVAVFSVFTFLVYFVLILFAFLYRGQPDFTLIHMFTRYYEWYGVFAAVLMLCYNGERGKGFQKLFYIYYPAHIYLFYALSWGLYLILN